MSSFNENIITEFRSNAGQVGGPFQGVPLLLLTTTGRRSGRAIVTPLAYTSVDERIVVAASNGGSDDDPAWFRNVQADPDVTVELGDRTISATAVVPDGTERDRLWAAHTEAIPDFGAYEERTDRTIPVVVLEPRPA
ncbi:deazaflavin-dependent oxidoreductase (nitroreductase family) [Haloactinopolyspora alba]|uniref:Deazaflavin-dependent oxidoreductase (Nitroreductase family) n=1 Tax=Haloactinopolyspora alba TaxID=648780 RepID=A0A2P8DX77_9ACTN|nr:nitroreductase family deazaflavin-dependent oxidoreductase [Haloactinopolyspora alba]PSL01777.1 deazaflavin-dependent oxidoreductase (nitroreductase family) [Haloactinopolyspora alba]